METKHKIYCFINGGSPGWYRAIAVGDDGVGLAGHVCSSEYYVPNDLGVTSNWKHEVYDAHFGAGNWETEFIPSDEIDTHEGLQALIKAQKEKEAVTQ